MAPAAAAEAVASEFALGDDGDLAVAVPGPEPRLASRSHRLAAAMVDVLLAFSAVLLLRVLVHLQWIAPIGVWRPDDTGIWIDTQLVFLSLALAALRDLAFGASPAKWLLCMRLARHDGGRLGLGERLLRAPISILPFAWLGRGMQQRMSWRVVSYTPGSRGQMLRATVAIAAAVLSTSWGVETVRPSIGRQDAVQLAQSLVAGDRVLERDLGGGPLDHSIVYITRRAHERGFGKRASFQIEVHSLFLQQYMMVHAVKIDGAWVVEEVSEIEINAINPGIARWSPPRPQPERAPILKTQEAPARKQRV